MKDLKSMIAILDPSDKFRPEKPEERFRDYTENSAFYDRVKDVYLEYHTKQTVEAVLQKRKEWTKFDHCEMTIMEALSDLNSLVDLSDPDLDVPNAGHAYQTAERIRQVHPDLDWFHLTGLIHDVGKILAVWGEPQHFVVGDTYPVGCSFSDEIVFGRESFKNNPDFKDPRYNTKYGMYHENIGLDNVIMSWGHDEYMYRVLKHNTCYLPEEALYIVRYHSFFPWHMSGQYTYLTNDKDKEMLPWVKEFNKFDLYSKSDEDPDMDALTPYYQSLIDKYIPGILKW